MLWCKPEANRPGDQSPPDRGTLLGVTAEGDTVTTTVCSGSTLKHTVPAPSADHSANVPRGACTDKEGLASPAGAGSPTPVSVSTRENGCEDIDGVSVPQGMNVHPLGATPHAGDGTGVTGGLREAGGCHGLEGTVGGVTSTAHTTLYSTPQREYPVGQPMVFGDLSSGMVTANLDLPSSVPNLLGLSAPAYTGTVQTGAFRTCPSSAARARSAPAARVDKSGSETALRDWLTMRPDLGRKARFRRSPMPWLVPASRAVLHTARWLNQGQTAPVIHSKWENMSVLGHVTKSAPTSCLIMPSSHL